MVVFSFFFKVFGLLLITPSIFAGPLASPSAKVVHERRNAAPDSWNQARRLHARDLIPLRIALTQNNLHLAEEKLYSVSDPSSENYGKHWTPNEIADFFAPSERVVSAVKSWLHEEGIHSDRVRLSNSKGWLHVETTAAEAERLLETEFHLYEHEDGIQHIGCEAYSLPEHVKHHVDLITPTVNLVRESSSGMSPKGKAKRSKLAPSAHIRPIPASSFAAPSSLASPAAVNTTPCVTRMTPACLQALYGINRTPTQTTKNSMAVELFPLASFVQSDLDLFFRNFSPSLVGKGPVQVSIDGGTSNRDVFDLDFMIDAEGVLEWAMTLTAPQPVQLYIIGDGFQQASYNTLLDALDASYCTSGGGDTVSVDGQYPNPNSQGFKGQRACGTVKPANVIQLGEQLEEVLLTPAYQQRQCAEYSKLGLAGTTVLSTSGFGGVGFFCFDNPQHLGPGAHFGPTWPSTCPFVTSVGGTQIDAGKAFTDPETANSGSAGGFSNTFALPSYQQAAVSSYFANHNPTYTSAQYNNSRAVRGFPDLAANSANGHPVASFGQFWSYDFAVHGVGVVGAMITLINDARIAAGKSTVGFINPSLYSAAFASAFNDITQGNNPGCDTDGFSAVPGWDPVTGLGTPNFPKLLAAFLALP